MAQTLDSLVVELGLDPSKYISGLNDSMSKTNEFGNAVVDKLAGLGNSAVLGALAATSAGVAAITLSLKECVLAGMDAEKNQAQLAAVIKSTGGAAGVTEQAALDLSNALAKVTTFEDDSILSAENLMLTFTSVSSKTFPDFIKIALDMSAALGQDLKSSIIQLGKAAGGEFANLQRVGVAFSDSQQDMMKAALANNDMLTYQKIILKELNTEFGGVAETIAKTAAGQWTVLKNRLLSLQDAIGQSLLPSLKEVTKQLGEPLVNAIEKAGNRLITFFGSDKMKEITDKFISLAKSIEDLVTSTRKVSFDEIIEKFSDLAKSVGVPVDLVDNLKEKFSKLYAFLVAHKDEIKSTVETFLTLATVATVVKDLENAINPLNIAIITLVGLAETLKKAWSQDIFGIQEKVKTGLDDTAKSSLNALESIRWNSILGEKDQSKIDSTNSIFFALEDSIQNLKSGNVVGFFTSLGLAVQFTADRFLNMKQIINDVQDTFTRLTSGQVGSLFDPTPIVDQFSKMSDALSVGQDFNKKNQIAEMFGAAGNSVKDLSAGNFVGAFLNIGIAFDTLFNKVLNINKIFLDARETFGQFVLAIQTGWIKINNDFLIPWKTQFQPTFDLFVKNLKKDIPEAFRQMSQTFAEEMKKITTEAGKDYDTVVKINKSAADTITETRQNSKTQFELLMLDIQDLWEKHLNGFVQNQFKQITLWVEFEGAIIKLVAVAIAKFIEVSLGQLIPELRGMTKAASQTLSAIGYTGKAPLDNWDQDTLRKSIDATNEASRKIAEYEPNYDSYIPFVTSPVGAVGLLLNKLVPSNANNTTNTNNRGGDTYNFYVDKDNASEIKNYIEQKRLISAP